MLIVSIADLAVAGGDETLVTYALGSCVGICLYDPVNKIIGLAHIMLPWSKEAASSENNMRRYADTGITELISSMIDLGAKKSQLTAKIAGGAQMFGVASSAFNIGERNSKAVQKILETYRIPIVAAEIGGNYARTMFCHASDGSVELRSANRETVKI